jgi:hypothetical protein
MRKPKATAVEVSKAPAALRKRVIKPKTPEVVEAAKEAVTAPRRPEESRF